MTVLDQPIDEPPAFCSTGGVIESHPNTQGLEAARATMERVFGFAAFRPGQDEVLGAIMAGEDVIAVMPTGSGKSLCYQLPAITRPGLTVVVSPLISLMHDQVRQLQGAGVEAAALHSGLSGEEAAATDAALRERRLKLLYVAPERLNRPDMAGRLRAAGTRLLAVDEAHCVSQWGHDFRPDYMAIRDLVTALGDPQIVAVTATADAPTRAEIAHNLFPREPRIFVRSFDRPNLYLAMMPKQQAAKQIRAFAEKHRGASGIVYCASRKRTEALAEMLRGAGFDALAYHAGLDPETRATRQDDFITREAVVMVATIAFGMGIDKPDVRFVAHADLPSSVESYYQEIGRAGRDGAPADTLTLYGDGDILLRRRQIETSDAGPAKKAQERQKLETLVALCETPRCRRQSLLALFGEDAKPCGHCDICDNRFGRFSGTLAARKMMSAILRTSGRFFETHLANILVGDETEAVRRHDHHRLPTFGVGGEHDVKTWRSVFRQIHAAALIRQDAEDRGRWVVTSEGRRVLAGDEEIELRAAAPAAAAYEASPTAGREAPQTVADSRLIAALKAKRLELARAERQPAYLVFPDRTLLAMASAKPRTLDAMGHLHGIGEAKLARYGTQFLKVISGHEPA